MKKVQSAAISFNFEVRHHSASCGFFVRRIRAEFHGRGIAEVGDSLDRKLNRFGIHEGRVVQARLLRGGKGPDAAGGQSRLSAGLEVIGIVGIGFLNHPFGVDVKNFCRKTARPFVIEGNAVYAEQDCDEVEVKTRV